MNIPKARQLYSSILLWCCFLSIILPLQAVADTVDVYGISFEVDKLRTVRGKKGVFQITIGSKVDLVPEAKLKAYVAEKILKKDPLRLKVDELKRLYRGAMQASDTAVSLLALHALFIKDDMKQADGVALVKEMCESVTQLAVCSQLLDQENLQQYNRAMLSEVVIESAARHEERVTSNLKKLSFLFNATFKEQLQESFRSAIRTGSGDGVISACIVIFGDADAFCSELKKKESGISHVLEDLKKGSFASLDKLTRQAARNPDFGYRIAPVVQKEIHRLTRIHLAKKEYTKALEAIAYLPSNWCTSETQQLAIDILQNVTSDELSNAALRTKNFIEGIKEQNADIGNIYESKLEESLYGHVRSGNLSEADAALLRLLMLRGDPNIQNDDLRFHLAMAHVKEGNDQRAKELIQDIGTSLSVTQRITLIMSGLYISRVLILGLLLSPFLGVLGWMGVRRVRYGNPGTRKPVVVPVDDDEEDDDLPLFSSRSMNRLDPRAQEYNRNLQLLGLEPGCDLRSIKSAYRAAVKELHPDRRKAMDEETNRKFHELQKAYEKVLNLRKEMGM